MYIHTYIHVDGYTYTYVLTYAIYVLYHETGNLNSRSTVISASSSTSHLFLTCDRNLIRLLIKMLHFYLISDMINTAIQILS